jgi:hypothetical protein
MTSHARMIPRLRATTALVLAPALLLAACGGGRTAASGKARAAPSAAGHGSPAPSAAPPPPAPPPTCPLTGQQVGSAPQRPALAIKIDNSPQARPQYGIDDADIVFEEPVEGGITRYVAVFQCRDAARVEPVRSARQADPYIVNQWGRTLFGNAGGSPPTLKAIASAVKAGWIVNVGYDTGGGYRRDPGRARPYNLETSTQALYSRPDAKSLGTTPPKPIFTYSATPAAGTPGTTIQVDFSQYSNVTWQWNAAAGAYQRYYNAATPSDNADGSVMSAQNVVIEAVPVTMSWWIEDPSGSHQPIPDLLGKGPALVCRLGSCVSGNWWRPGEGLSQPTYLMLDGQPIDLTPGVTWVELVPSSVTGPTAIPVGSYSAS